MDESESAVSESILQLSSGLKTTLCITTMVAHFICALFTGYIVFTAKPGSSLFSWHPTLMTIAYAFFMAESILFFSPQSSLIWKSNRKTKVKYHWIGLLLAASCAVSGWFCIWYNKELTGNQHGATTHGKLGFICVLYTLAQCLGGIFLNYPSLSMKFIKYSRLKTMHVASGLIMFLLACGSLVLGMYSTWFTDMVTGTSWYASVACPVLLAVIVINQVSNNQRKGTGATSKSSAQTQAASS